MTCPFRRRLGIACADGDPPFVWTNAEAGCVVGADVVQHVPGLAQPERRDLTVGPQPVAEVRFDVVPPHLADEHPGCEPFEAFSHRPFLSCGLALVG
jgi:hypothetical protein